MVKTNDMMLVIYLASLIRSVTALHDLINNKIEFQTAEKRERENENKPAATNEDDKKTDKDKKKDHDDKKKDDTKKQ